MRKSLSLFLLVFFFVKLGVHAQQNPKREFRGAWIQCVNNQFQGLGRDRMQETLTYQLDELQRTGINTIIFQVRAEGDALYPSAYEPWSRFLTGRQGVAPAPYWDPLAWMIQEAHKRGMELHAWINPFRAKTKGTPALTSPYYNAHPDRFFEYDGLWIFDPAIPENRDYICFIVQDIISRYDVDGLHIDDYFYPYPVAGLPIPDGHSYQRYGQGQNIQDWRRQNVNTFMKQLSQTIRQTKPWVKFSVSPFGIYRNQKSDPAGSRTNGLQNYDDLYADILLWVREGWVDLNIPQIYWQIGHPAADYEELIRWWNEHAPQRPLIVGQDVERTVKYAATDGSGATQTLQKYNLQRRMSNVAGSCQWYAKACVDNPQGYATTLRQTFHSTIALQPEMPWIDKKAPRKVRGIKLLWTQDGPILMWRVPRRNKKEMQTARKYVVYRFAKGQQQDLGNPANIHAITTQPFLKLNYEGGKQQWTYVVTALDRLQNESKGKKKTIRL